MLLELNAIQNVNKKILTNVVMIMMLTVKITSNKNF